MNYVIKKNYILTKSLRPGESVYGEKLVKIGGIEYRAWDPRSSKLAAAILKGIDFPLKDNTILLYLGASTGSSVSHLSDIFTSGKIYAVEIAKEVGVKLILLAEKRNNIYPIIADARKPEVYRDLVEDAEFVYQDIPQKDQIDIFLRNLNIVKGKRGLIVIKTRSIDVSKSVESIAKEEVEKIKAIAKVNKVVKLSPYYSDHIAVSVSL
jgi:fibrillarin-like pre-rRNA processing protein